MTKEDLIGKHIMRGHTDRPIDNANVSIEYAIDVLEELRDKWFKSSDGYKQLDNKMQELKSLLK